MLRSLTSKVIQVSEEKKQGNQAEAISEEIMAWTSLNPKGIRLQSREVEFIQR